MSRAWMPLYIGDYLRDTAHLSTVEHGAYLLLIMSYWQQGELPQDDKRLARIAKLTPAEWAEARDTIAEFFGDGWSHARIDAEIKIATENSEKARDKANKRWSRGKADAAAMLQHVPEDKPRHMPVHVPQQCPSPSPVEPNGSSDDTGEARHHRLPKSHRLSEADRKFARDAGWTEGEINDEEVDFVTYWSNPKLPASKALKVDWAAVWRGRVRDLGKRRGAKPRANANVTPFRGGHDASRSATAEARRQLERELEREAAAGDRWGGDLLQIGGPESRDDPDGMLSQGRSGGPGNLYLIGR